MAHFSVAENKWVPDGQASLTSGKTPEKTYFSVADNRWVIVEPPAVKEPVKVSPPPPKIVAEVKPEPPKKIEEAKPVEAKIEARPQQRRGRRPER